MLAVVAFMLKREALEIIKFGKFAGLKDILSLSEPAMGLRDLVTEASVSAIQRFLGFRRVSKLFRW